MMVVDLTSLWFQVERFKALQSSKDSLHCRFHHITGDASHDDEDYGHLQVISCIKDYFVMNNVGLLK